jgi:hypothetical protein
VADVVLRVAHFSWRKLAQEAARAWVLLFFQPYVQTCNRLAKDLRGVAGFPNRG